jgi:hypothetical protein
MALLPANAINRRPSDGTGARTQCVHTAMAAGAREANRFRMRTALAAEWMREPRAT